MSAIQKTLWLLSAVVLVCSGVSCGSSKVKLNGQGATFPEPLYNKWCQEYAKTHKGVQINYQGVGSGEGIKGVIDHTVDFGASDVGMKPEEMENVEGGVQLLPMTAGSIVVAYNVEGVKELNLTRKAYAGIFQGAITKWDDDEIKSANPGVTLPAARITVVVRAEASGTTGVFTKHLCAISDDFKKVIGEGKTVNWPKDFIRQSGNPGVVATLTQTANSIGYVEFAYARDAAKDGKVLMAKLQNKAGEAVLPSSESGKATLSSIQLPENFLAFDSNPDGKASYPIVTYTWIICYKTGKDAKKAAALREFLTWCVTDGQKMSEEAGYIPLPEAVAEKVKAAIKNVGPADKS